MAARKKSTKRHTKKRPLAKETASSALLSGLKAKFGSSVTTLERQTKAEAQIKEFIPSGIDVVDRYVIGRGGFPVGRMSEMFGPEGCGKTAFLYAALAANQRRGGVSLLLDAEFSFDEERARAANMDMRGLLLAYPEHLDEALQMIKTALSLHDPRRGPFLIGLDSLASLKTKSGVSLEIGEKHYRGEAQMLSNELRDLPRLCHKHRAHICFVNQIRQKMGGGGYGGPEITTPGGNAPKFYCSLRLQFFGGKSIKNKNDEHTGKVVTIMCVKSRLQAPFKKAKVRFDYETGYNDAWTTVQHAKRLGLVKPPKRGRNAPSLREQYLDALEVLDWEYNKRNAALGSDLEPDEPESGESED